MKTTLAFMGVPAVALFTLAVAPVPAGAASVADFYKGQRIQMLIGYSAGGGYDRYARLQARHMGKHIPGDPTFVSKNMTGAGGMRSIIAMYNTLPQDGTFMAIVGRQIPLEPLKGNKKARFRGDKLQWLGSPNQETSVCAFWHSSPIKTVDDMFNKSPVVGGTGAGSGTDTQALMLNNLMHTRLRLVTGYPGGVDINLAMERGEVMGRCAWSWSSVIATHKDWVDEKKVVFPLQIAFRRHPDLKNVPLVTDFVTKPLDRAALNMVLTPLKMGRPFAVGPKVPADRVKALRVAFMATMKDPDYVREAKRARLPLDPVSGDEVQALVKSLYSQPKEVIQRMAEAISGTNNIQITKAVIKNYTYFGKITKVKRGGKRVSWKGPGGKGKLRVGGKTKITVGGKKAKRKALKVGMNCTFKVKGAQKALSIACK